MTPPQEHAAEVLAAGQRVGDVAKAVGVDRATVWRWTRLPEFQEAVNDLRRAAWRAAADRMRANASLAADVLGAVMADATAPARDRIAAARVTLTTAGPLFPPASKGTPEPVESRGVPLVKNDDWRAAMTETARRAGEMAGHLYLNLRTPGSAWAESGLEAAFPGSFNELRTLAGKPDELRAACAEILTNFADALDARAIAEAVEEAAADEKAADG